VRVFCCSARTLHSRAVLLTRHVCALASRARLPNQSQMKPPVGNTQQGTKTQGEGQRPRLKDEATTTRVVGPTLACEPSTFHSTPARTCTSHQHGRLWASSFSVRFALGLTIRRVGLGCCEGRCHGSNGLSARCVRSWCIYSRSRERFGEIYSGTSCKVGRIKIRPRVRS
jgi:hypothetical protein